jgi:type IV secretion/conjugal transfer VirB4 family ATPase
MLFLNEYRRRSARLFDHLPWAILVAPGVVLNKDGSFQQTLEYRGPDLASATAPSLVVARARLNNALRRLGSRWCLHFEAVRTVSKSYPAAAFPDPVSHIVDEERRAAFAQEAAHFETRYFLTLTYLPPRDAVGRAESLLVENLPAGRGAEALYRAALEGFHVTVMGVRDILAGMMSDVGVLGDGETLTYLHACVSTKSHLVAPPPIPAYLDAYLTDDDLQGGLHPRLGDHHLRTLSIRAYPSLSSPGVLDELNLLGIPYRWACRFLPLDKEDARQAVTALRKRWFARRKGVMALLKEAITHEPTALEDPDALVKTEDADAVLMVVGGDAASLGYFTPTLTLLDRDPDRLAEQVRAVEAVINRAGFVAKVEDVNAVEAWLGSLPGHAYADVRRPLVSTLNLCDMLPVSAVWPGPTENRHLSSEGLRRGHAGPQPPLMHARTGATTPFRLDLHQGDVGHTLVIGPTGAGKSVLLNTLALQWRRYPEAQVVVFDKGRSARASTLLVGGRHYDLGRETSNLAFQPLAGTDAPEHLAWAQDWLLDLLAGEKLILTPEIKQEVWSALRNLGSGPPDQRTLTVLSATIQDQAVKAALSPYVLGGSYGSLLDAARDTLAEGPWLAFEMGELMARRGAVGPVLTYLFHCLEQRFDGRPTLLVLDEAWLYLESTAFAGKIREWLKTLRKRNVAVIFATQSLADVAGSTIAAALVEGCPTRIFLPNPDARSPQIAALYERFGLNGRQLELIAGATPKRDYYYQSAAGDRLFELGLGPVALAAVGAATPADQVLMDRLLADDPKGFPAAFYRAQGLPEVADFLTEFDA